MNGPLRLTVLRTGYLGITHAACMAALGFDVLGVDVDVGKVERLNAGRPFGLIWLLTAGSGMPGSRTPRTGSAR